jgi:hypothetical protein
MEAILNSVEYSYNTNEMKVVINNCIQQIEDYITINNYKVVGDIKYIDKQNSDQISKNQMKKIQKYCFWISKKPTLRRINSFLSLLYRTYKIEKVRVNISDKEVAIQKARKDWKKSLAETEKLLAEYKNEKGNFYKDLVK